MRPLISRFRNGSASSKGWARPSLALAFGALGAAAIVACGSSTGPGTGFDTSSNSNSRTSSNSTGTKTSVVTTTSTGTTTLADGGVVTTTTTGTTTTTITTTNTSTTGGSTQTSGSGSTSSTSTGGGGDAGGDGGFVCTNTDMTKLNIDSSGWVCNNKYNIQGAWYCYADKAGTSTCTGEGDIPFDSTKSAMCISGTTAASTDASTAFGAGIGLVLNQPMHGNDAKNAFNATAANIVGFAITISGTTGGSALNVNFPQQPQLTTSGEAAAVTIPALAGTSTTFNVLLGNAIISDNTTSPIPKFDPTKVSDVQVAIPGADGIAHAYNYCVTNIVPLTAAPAAPGSNAAYGAQFNEGKQIVLEGLGAYGLQNDPFGVGTDQMNMTASYGGGQVGFSATPMFNSGTSSPGAFPSIVWGWVHGGNYVSSASGGYTGGKTIGSMSATSVTSNWSWTAGNSNNWDAAYDTWFAGSTAPISAGTELMVWLGHGSGTSPIGGINGNARAVTGAPGMWNVATGTNPTGQPVVSYVATSSMTSVTSFPLSAFFKDAVSNNLGQLSASSNLLSVQAGFELYNAGTWTTSSFSITSN
jgi:hypothetical protein